MLQGDTHKYNEANHKRHITISYDLTDATPEERQHQRRMIPTPTTLKSSTSHQPLFLKD